MGNQADEKFIAGQKLDYHVQGGETIRVTFVRMSSSGKRARIEMVPPHFPYRHRAYVKPEFLTALEIKDGQ